MSARAWVNPNHHAAVREAVRAFCRVHGVKRGLHLAAQRIGMGSRAAQHAYEGGPFAADAERAARADEARLALINEQIARLRAEADEIRGLDVAMARPALDGGSGVLRASSGGVFQAGEVTR